MNIHLTQANVERAIGLYLAKRGIGIGIQEIIFTKTRGEDGLLADVVFCDDEDEVVPTIYQDRIDAQAKAIEIVETEDTAAQDLAIEAVRAQQQAAFDAEQEADTANQDDPDDRESLDPEPELASSVAGSQLVAACPAPEDENADEDADENEDDTDTLACDRADPEPATAPATAPAESKTATSGAEAFVEAVEEQAPEAVEQPEVPTDKDNPFGSPFGAAAPANPSQGNGSLPKPGGAPAATPTVSIFG